MVTKLKQEQEDYDEIVQSYLDKQYRPFSVNDIVNNLSKEINKKSIILKALDSLVKQNRIVVKSFGKVQIYCCLDKQLAPDIDLEVYNLTSLSNLRTELIDIEKTNSTVSETWNTLERELKNEELVQYNDNISIQIDELTTKISQVKKNTQNSNIDQSKINKLIELNNKIEKDYKTRSKNMKDLISLLKDVTQLKNIDDLLENIGVEAI